MLEELQLGVIFNGMKDMLSTPIGFPLNEKGEPFRTIYSLPKSNSYPPGLDPVILSDKEQSKVLFGCRIGINQVKKQVKALETILIVPRTITDSHIQGWATQNLKIRNDDPRTYDITSTVNITDKRFSVTGTIEKSSNDCYDIDLHFRRHEKSGRPKVEYHFLYRYYYVIDTYVIDKLVILNRMDSCGEIKYGIKTVAEYGLKHFYYHSNGYTAEYLTVEDSFDSLVMISNGGRYLHNSFLHC